MINILNTDFATLQDLKYCLTFCSTENKTSAAFSSLFQAIIIAPIDLTRINESDDQTKQHSPHE